ncbi:Aryl hydrocarbon receptor [Acipenser ruthenus]|uniref:Aryl hydrocarbon receptor n=1 Tax=Acipenser ruthenus TaxID=7906 RepID=A0A444UPY7_ACIRT|nr:Aryl hydrocarbon receptor [Acipenser ruthenus]
MANSGVGPSSIGNTGSRKADSGARPSSIGNAGSGKADNGAAHPGSGNAASSGPAACSGSAVSGNADSEKAGNSGRVASSGNAGCGNAGSSGHAASSGNAVSGNTHSRQAGSSRPVGGAGSDHSTDRPMGSDEQASPGGDEQTSLGSVEQESWAVRNRNPGRCRTGILGGEEQESRALSNRNPGCAKPSLPEAKSNPSKRHRDRLNTELERLASLLPFPQDVISKLDKLSVLRLSVSYLRAKSFFSASINSNSCKRPAGNGLHDVNKLPCDELLEGELLLQVLNGFVLVVTADGLVFYVSSTLQDYLGFNQSDVIHQSVYELIHTEDRAEFQRQLHWALNPGPPPDSGQIVPAADNGLSLPVTYYNPEKLPPENSAFLERNFVCRLRCLLDNSSGFLSVFNSFHALSERTDVPVAPTPHVPSTPVTENPGPDELPAAFITDPRPPVPPSLVTADPVSPQPSDEFTNTTVPEPGSPVPARDNIELPVDQAEDGYFCRTQECHICIYHKKWQDC